MTVRRWGLLVASAVLVLAVASPGLAQAAGAPTKLVMQPPMALPVQQSNPEAVMVLGATLTKADGSPIANQRVEFLMGTDILGKKNASIGTAVSDASGSARTTFVVTRSGSYQFSARYAGTELFAGSEAAVLDAQFEALAVPHPAADSLQLNRIGRWVPWAGLGLGVAVWLVLIYVAASVLFVMRREAGREREARGN